MSLTRSNRDELICRNSARKIAERFHDAVTPDELEEYIFLYLTRHQGSGIPIRRLEQIAKDEADYWRPKEEQDAKGTTDVAEEGE